jgi:hypothetical protein
MKELYNLVTVTYFDKYGTLYCAEKEVRQNSQMWLSD